MLSSVGIYKKIELIMLLIKPWLVYSWVCWERKKEKKKRKIIMTEKLKLLIFSVWSFGYANIFLLDACLHTKDILPPSQVPTNNEDSFWFHERPFSFIWLHKMERMMEKGFLTCRPWSMIINFRPLDLCYSPPTNSKMSLSKWDLGMRSTCRKAARA